tara:strand:- start:1049 stop:1483 length:435 start_codon:yes stop_codon:yes gene_type:complete
VLTIPIKKKTLQKKNIKLGKNKFNILILTFFFIFFVFTNSFSSNNLEGPYTIIKILDKISSKNDRIKLENKKEIIFKDLSIKSMKCSNSEFDDNPEIKAYLQVKDLTNQNKDNVFIFNGWMFSSSPSIKPFDHPVYDIWLIGCS